MQNLVEPCEIGCPLKEWRIQKEVVTTMADEVIYGENGIANLFMKHTADIEPLLAGLPTDHELFQQMQAIRQSLVNLTETNDQLGAETVPEKLDFEAMTADCDGRKIEDDPNDPAKILIYCGSRAISEEQRFSAYKRLDK